VYPYAPRVFTFVGTHMHTQFSDYFQDTLLDVNSAALFL